MFVLPSLAIAATCALGPMTCLVNAQSPLITIETVPVGNINNAPDNVVMPDGTSSYGSVNYKYRIGKYEITASQYCIFLNAVAQSDPFGLYLEQMAADPNVRSITRNGSSGAYMYSVIPGCEDKPISYVTWFNAARFCNWLHNGATAGASTEIGAYILNGATTGVEFTHQSNARFRLPTENEWYKAAFYDPNKNSGTGGYWKYSNRSDSMSTTQANYLWAHSDANGNRLTDVGYFSSSVSAYGTYDQGGNLWEWTEAVVNGTLRGMRGGGFTEIDGGGPTFYNTGHFGGNPGNVAPGENGFNGWGNGFRVVAIGDFDNDGVNDYREGKDGTDPNDPSSFNPLSKGLVAYYTFDGNANDESGYGLHLTENSVFVRKVSPNKQSHLTAFRVTYNPVEIFP